MPVVSREFSDYPPYFAYAVTGVLYVTRGRAPRALRKPLKMREWIDYVGRAALLELDESHRERNPHLDREEEWIVRGRSRWLGSPTDRAEHVYFAAARIAHRHGVMRGGPAADKHAAFAAKLGVNPSLEEWLHLVDHDRFLHADLELGEPGRILWKGRDGRVKHVFRYLPPSAWIYKWPPPCDKSDGNTELRRRLMEGIAADLDCELWDGLGPI